MKKTCKQCGKNKYSFYFKVNGDVCKVCRQPTKVRKAHRAVANAVWNKDILPAKELKCASCGNNAILYHHEDYNKPLDVVPLCGKCHWNRHQEI